jgi:hypothetical protein
MEFEIAAGAAIMTAKALASHAAAFGADLAAHDIDPEEIQQMLERGDKSALAAALPGLMQQITAASLQAQSQPGPAPTNTTIQ